MTIPIIDLHCDLLFHLGVDNSRTPYDPEARCSVAQLKRGGVKLQTMAVFTETGPDSVRQGMHQVHLFQKLPENYPGDFQHFSNDWSLSSPRINILMSIENASGFCDEREPLQEGFKRLKEIVKGSRLLYVSLTWNTENRFGGGALSRIGLKEDGKLLLDELDGEQIALDLSHASDALANDAINYIEARSLNIPLIASHSNSRKVTDVPRNLPDEIAKEIFRRDGVVGLNLFGPFVGASPNLFASHVARWLELGGEKGVVFGADFFNDTDLPSTHGHGQDVFFRDYSNAACYGEILLQLRKELNWTDANLERVAHQNALAFFKKNQSLLQNSG